MSRTPTDILDELGLLPADDADQTANIAPDDHISASNPAPAAGRSSGAQPERRQSPRLPTERAVRLVMLANDQPLGDPFVATTVDVSAGGMRLVGKAPLLHGGRAVVELTNADGATALLGARVRHTTFGHASKMTNDNTSTAGLEFFKLDDDLVQRHFVTSTGDVGLG
jgi:hypothetical protein